MANETRSCKELIDALFQSGGKFICDYQKENCTLDSHNGLKLTCKLEYPKTAVDIDSLLFFIAPWHDEYVSYLPLDKRSGNSNCTNTKILLLVDSKSNCAIIQMQIKNPQNKKYETYRDIVYVYYNTTLYVN